MPQSTLRIAYHYHHLAHPFTINRKEIEKRTSIRERIICLSLIILGSIPTCGLWASLIFLSAYWKKRRVYPLSSPSHETLATRCRKTWDATLRLDHLLHPRSPPKTPSRKVSTKERIASITLLGLLTLSTGGILLPYFLKTAGEKRRKIEANPQRATSRQIPQSVLLQQKPIDYSLEENIDKVLALRSACDASGKKLSLYVGWTGSNSIAHEENECPVTFSFQLEDLIDTNRPDIYIDGPQNEEAAVHSSKIKKIHHLFDRVVLRPRVLGKFVKKDHQTYSFFDSNLEDPWTKFVHLLRENPRAELISEIETKYRMNIFFVPEERKANYAKFGIAFGPTMKICEDVPITRMTLHDFYYLKTRFNSVELMTKSHFPGIFNPPECKRPFYVLKNPIQEPVPWRLVKFHSALHYAVWMDDDPGIEKLLQQGLQMSENQNFLRRTPLHTAVYYEKRKALLALLKNNADKTKKDIFGLTPLDIAKKKNDATLINLLSQEQPKDEEYPT